MIPTKKDNKFLNNLEIQNKNLAILYETSKIINSVSTIEKLIDKIKSIVVSKINYDYFSIYLLDEGNKILKQIKIRGRKIQLSIEEGITGYVVKTGIPLMINDVSKDKRYIQVRKDTKSELSVPIKINDKIIGAINIESKKISFFTENDLSLITALSEQLGSSINRLITTERVNQSYERLENINKIGKAVNSSLDIDFIFKLILNNIAKELNYDLIAILLIENDKLFSRAGLGFTKKELDTYSAHIGEGICGVVAKSGKPILSNDITKIPFYKRQAGRTRSELSVPMIVNNKVIGVLNVESQNKDAFDHDDLIYLSALADQVSAAINNAKTYNEIQEFNITLKKEVTRATKELLNANVELKRLNEIKSDFVSTVSHELRTPLTSILGYVSVIRDGDAGTINNDQKEFLGIVKEEGERLLRLVSDLLDISRIESGKMKVMFSKFDFAKFFSEYTKELKSITNTKSIQLIINLPKKITVINADEDKIKQIFYNLVSNAVKFSQKNTFLTINITENKKKIQIDVIDKGIGIKKQDINKLFKKFSQIDSKMTRETSGTGLGLAICDYLVKAHNGDIWVESVDGQGSTFSFTVNKSL